MKISKTIPVALATVFTLTTVGAGFALAAASGPGKPRVDDAKVQTANYRHHDGGKGSKHMRGQRGGPGGLDRLIESFDTDGDGGVTQDEIITARTTRLSEFDANKDGSLDLTEYQALWLDAMHERMVDQFQAHDDDGDGKVTVEEFNERFTKIVERRDRNGDGVLNADDAKRPPRKGPGGPEDQKGPGGPGGQ